MFRSFAREAETKRFLRLWGVFITDLITKGNNFNPNVSGDKIDFSAGRGFENGPGGTIGLGPSDISFYPILEKIAFTGAHDFIKIMQMDINRTDFGGKLDDDVFGSEGLLSIKVYVGRTTIRADVAISLGVILPTD
jgi:hypothetical protein